MSAKHFFKDELLNSSQLAKIALQRYSTDNFCEPGEAFNADNKLFLETITDIFVYSNYFPKEELQNFSVNLILNYLEKTHQHYLNKSLPEIEQTISTLKEDYSQTDPCLHMLAIFFLDYRKHLIEHINYEETSFFPYIKHLLKLKAMGSSSKINDIITKQYSLNDFCKEHTDNEISLKNVRQAIFRYKPSATNQSPYRILLTQLKVFEMDLHLHARIEEEILLPKIVALENEIKTEFIIETLKN